MRLRVGEGVDVGVVIGIHRVVQSTSSYLFPIFAGIILVVQSTSLVMLGRGGKVGGILRVVNPNRGIVISVGDGFLPSRFSAISPLASCLVVSGLSCRGITRSGASKPDLADASGNVFLRKTITPINASVRPRPMAIPYRRVKIGLDVGFPRPISAVSREPIGM